VWKHETNEAIREVCCSRVTGFTLGTWMGPWRFFVLDGKSNCLLRARWMRRSTRLRAPIGDALYLATANRLYLITTKLSPGR
jgi:hypothetical protein